MATRRIPKNLHLKNRPGIAGPVVVGMSPGDAQYFVDHMQWAKHYRDGKYMLLFGRIKDALSFHLARESR